MKKTVLTLAMLITTICSQAQTVGDQLNYIRQEKPGGQFDTDDKPYTYSVLEKDINTLMIYFLNENLVCYQIVIVPQSPLARQRWVSSFNDSWVIINSNLWKFYKESKAILVCSIDYVDKVGSVFSIKEEGGEGVEN